MKKIIVILLGIIFNCFFGQNLTGDENYIYKKTHLSDPADPVQKQIENVQYLDGLGRPKQIISIKSAPSQKDLVTPVVYDQFGRRTKNYLSVPVPTANAAIQASVTENTVNAYYGTGNAFFEKNLEFSPLSRISESASPGEEWEISAGHTVTYEYDANSADDQVLKYQISTTWDNGNQIYNSAPLQKSYYDENLLYKYRVKDEDHNEKIIFKDPYGHIVLIRKNDSTQNLDTYYVYDQYDQLTYVIPPLAAVAPFTQITLDNLCYQYRYDNKRRVVEKKLPGKGLELLVYDKQNRLVLSQDAVLRGTENTFNKRGWLFTKYDKLGRVAYHGFFNNTAPRTAMQTALNNMSANAWNNETRSSIPFTLGNVQVYYTKNAFPTGSMTILGINYYDTYPVLPAGVTMPPYVIEQQQAVLSQDAQTFSRSTKGFPTASYVKNIEDDNWTANFIWYDTKGRAVSTHTVNHLGGYTRTEMLLDFTGTPQRMNTYHARKQNESGVKVQERFVYDHQNRLTQHYHQVDDKPEQLLAENTYDDFSRIINKKVGFSSGVPLQSIDYAYNIRGWLTHINKDQMAMPDLGGKLFSYKIRYAGMEGISNPDSSLFPGKNVVPKYNGNIAEVDWRAVETLGENPSPAPKRYGYSYDGVNRLKAGYYQNPYNPNSKENTESLGYDLNGNITSLYRTSVIESGTTPSAIDNLEYFYENGNNQLTRVIDHSHNPTGYEGGGSLIGYDANGNMKNMADKGIGKIRYNFLDLPDYVNLQRNDIENVTIDTKYSADGTKLSKTNTTVITGVAGNTTTKKITDYLDGFQYLSTVYVNGGGSSESMMLSAPVETKRAMELQAFTPEDFPEPGDPGIDPPIGGGIVTAEKTPDLQFFPTAEGFYDYKKDQYIYHYQDQVGNIRISYGRNSGTGLLEIVDQNDYYPFGMNHLKTGYAHFGAGNYKNYKYQEQELQETGFYGFKWRNYMPDLGRFFNIDPLSEMYAYQSHYNFSENRVTDAREIEGLEAELLNKSDSESSTSGASFEGERYNGGLSSFTTWNDGVKGADIQNIDLGTIKSSSNQNNTFTWGDAGRAAVGFVPVVGSGLDIYEGARDGNWVQFGIGIGGLALDVATLGAGSVIKGGVKTIGTELIEGGLEMAAKDAAKEIAESEAKQGMKALSREEMSGVWGKGSDYMYSDYNQARNAALKWLDSQGFKAEQQVFGKFGTSEGKAIGMKNADANIGFRVEFDVRSGSHINVFSGKLKGPHFQFKGSEKTLNNIITRFSK